MNYRTHENNIPFSFQVSHLNPWSNPKLDLWINCLVRVGTIKAIWPGWTFQDGPGAIVSASATPFFMTVNGRIFGCIAIESLQLISALWIITSFFIVGNTVEAKKAWRHMSDHYHLIFHEDNIQRIFSFTANTFSKSTWWKIPIVLNLVWIW